ncbi:MAG: hypothetical protein JNM43_09210 [Planctomycetaceae bacterium]|nr:hypothetical protein [Planctomycetaceae bacterium]
MLEQDKRVRQQFKTAFEPLLSRTSHNHVNLASINQPNSHSWLVGTMIQQLEEADTSECIGAGFWVATIIGDGHSLSGRAAHLLRSKGIPFLDGVFSGIVDSHTERSASRWVLRLAIERLVSSSSDTLTIRSVSNALAIIAGADKIDFNQVAGTLTLSDEHRDLIWECAISKRRRDGVSASNDVQEPELEHVTHGSVVASYLKDDWTGGIGSTITSARFDLSVCVGFSRLLVAISAFHNLRTRASFLDVILELTSTKEPLLSCLSSYQRARFPALDRSVPLKKLRAIVEKQTDGEFESSLKTRKLGAFVLRRWAITFSVTGNQQLDDFAALVTERPAVAVILVFGQFSRRFPGEAIDSALVDRFRAQALETPSVFVDHAEILGAIFLNKDICSARDAIVREAERFPTRMPRLLSWCRLHPFVIRLPDERALLPPLLAGVIRHCRFEVRSPFEEFDVAKLLLQYEMKHEELVSIADDLGTPLFQRGAAVVFGMLQAGAFARTLARFESILLECAVERNELLIDAISFAISIKGSHQELSCTSFVGRLFDVLKHDYVGRRKVQSILDIWRERSIAPVTTSNAMTKWISSSD